PRRRRCRAQARPCASLRRRLTARRRSLPEGSLPEGTSLLRVLTPEDPLTPGRARGRLPAGPAALALSRAPAGEGADREQPRDEASDVREERHSAFGAPDGSQPE